VSGGGESCREMAWGGMRGGPCPSIYSHGGGIRGRDESDSRLEGGVNRAKLKFTNINTTTSRVSVRNVNESARDGAKQIASK
jgi:hypothetical protein